MRTILTVLLAGLAATGTACRSPATLETLLERHAAAVAADDAVERGAILVELEIVEPGFVLIGRYAASRDGRMRIDVFSDGTRVFSEGLDGDAGWQWHGGEQRPEPISDAGERALRHGVVANLYDLHERPALGYALSDEGHVSDADGSFRRVKSVAPDGTTQWFLIDTDTALVARTLETKALHPDIDPTEVPFVTHLSEYREHGGRRVAHRMEKFDRNTGELVQTTVVTRLVVNPPNIDELLARP